MRRSEPSFASHFWLRYVQLVARALYLLTGVLTGVPVVWALSWAVWGAGISVTEYASLFGSVLLLVAALSSARRIAARLALGGTVAIWSFYLPAVLAVVGSWLGDQELRLTVLLWAPSDSPLVIVQPSTHMSLSAEEVQRIKDTGITGTVSVYAANGRYGSGKKSSVILIMQGPVRQPIRLRQPDATGIIYLQEREHWSMFPSNAHTLKRTIDISPSPGDLNPSSVMVMVELSTGASQGFGVSWPREELRNRAR